MTDPYTPVTEVIRADWVSYRTHGAPMTRIEMGNSFDRWFASEISSAEARGYFKSVQDAYNNRMRLEEEQ